MNVPTQRKKAKSNSTSAFVRAFEHAKMLSLTAEIVWQDLDPGWQAFRECQLPRFLRFLQPPGLQLALQRHLKPPMERLNHLSQAPEIACLTLRSGNVKRLRIVRARQKMLQKLLAAATATERRWERVTMS